MTDHQKKIDDILAQEGAVLRAAVARCLAAYNRDSSVDNRRRLQEAKKALAEHEGPSGSEGGDLWFKGKTPAFEWYADQGGIRAKSSFFATVATDGKRVSRLAVSEMLRKERTKNPAVVDRSLEKEELEIRKLKAEVEQKEKANRKDDDRWMEVAEHEIQMAAFAGLIEDTLKQFTTLRLMELVYLCGGDVRKAAEFNQGLEDLFAAAFTDAVREQVRPVGFEEEDEDAEYGD